MSYKVKPSETLRRSQLRWTNRCRFRLRWQRSADWIQCSCLASAKIGRTTGDAAAGVADLNALAKARVVSTGQRLVEPLTSPPQQNSDRREHLAALRSPSRCGCATFGYWRRPTGEHRPQAASLSQLKIRYSTLNINRARAAPAGGGGPGGRDRSWAEVVAGSRS
jgi:hypothetical protein